MAHLGPGTAKADFFILTTDIPALDASAGDQGFAVFGRVIEGLDVAKKILASPVSPTKGEGAMKGQMLEPAVKIVKAERLPD
jgi:peptidyl-prolyl cis-trans isomerase A (cyclophilin A)